MKKYLLGLVIAGSLAGSVLVPLTASAQDKLIDSCTLRHDITFDGNTYTAGTVVCDTTSQVSGCTQLNQWGVLCLLDTVITVTDWIFVVLVILVGLLVIIGAFQIVTSAGDPQKLASGRRIIMWAIIGFLIALFSKAVPAIVKALVGVT